MQSLRDPPITQIGAVPGLYISDITIPETPHLLRKYGITHILSLTNGRQCPQIDPRLGIQHVHIDIDDNPYADLVMCLEGICAWIRHALQPRLQEQEAPSVSLGNEDSTSSTKQQISNNTSNPPTPKPVPMERKDPNVLVHCVQGQSRSGAIITAYLMRTLSHDYPAALVLAQKSRPSISPNSGFSEQLRLWETLGYTIYKPLAADLKDQKEEGREKKKVVEEMTKRTTRETSTEYEEWRGGRGILLSRGEIERREALMERVAGLVEEFGRN